MLGPRPAVLLLGCLALGGCASVTGYPARVSQDGAPLAPGISDAAYYAAKDAPAKQAEIRNELIFARLRAVNEQYDRFTRSLTTENNVTTLGSAITVVGLGAAGTIVKSPATKTALAAATTVVSGGAAAVDKNLFFSKTIPAVIAQMDSDRAKVLVTLYTGLKQPVSAYPLSAAEDAVDDYQRAGSLPSAISKLTAATEHEASKAKAEAADALVGTYSFDDSGKDLQAFVWPNGVKDAARYERVRAAMTARGVDAEVSVTSFLHMNQFAAQRAQVAADLGLK
jgi:hypothetical protein